MTDRMTREQRSRCMASIKGKDTKPEMIVRRYLFSKGLRYRVNSRKLPGSPDIVLKKYGTVVFIDGCFWHGHEDCRNFKMPKSNIEYWEHKIRHNRARDIADTTVLKLMGWRVIRIWECEITTASMRQKCLENLYNTIVHPLSQGYSESQGDATSIAAEKEEPYG